MIDPAFGVNSFNEPKYYSESQTAANNIMMILYGKPGFYPSIPDLGMDVPRLNDTFFDDLDTDQIKSELARQCNVFIDNIRDGTFDVQKSLINGKPLLIFVVPVISEQVPQRIAIGITTNEQGELIYRMRYADAEDDDN